MTRSVVLSPCAFIECIDVYWVAVEENDADHLRSVIHWRRASQFTVLSTDTSMGLSRMIRSSSPEDFYHELIRTEPVDYKYYAVDDGNQIRTAGRRVTSKLYGPKRFLSRTRTRPRLTARLRRLVELAGLRGIGVDFVKDDQDRLWAVDVNLAAGYRDTGLEPALSESISTCLPDQ